MRATTSGSRRSRSGSASTRSSNIPTTRPDLYTQIINALYKATEGEALVVADVGQHQMFAAQYYKFEEPDVADFGRLGTMGFSLPAPSARSARGRQVWAIAGDGCFQMNLQELRS